MSNMKNYAAELEELNLENARLNNLYSHSLKLQNKLHQENKELKQELDNFKMLYPLLEEGYNGQYKFAKQLSIENSALYNELFSLKEKINITLAVHGVNSNDREQIIEEIYLK